MNKDELRRCMIARRNSLNNKDIEKKVKQSFLIYQNCLSINTQSLFLFT